MTTLEQLLEAARRQPEDLLGWSAVADLLEEQGETDRAEVLRLDLWLRQAGHAPRERETRHRRLRELLEAGVPPCLPGFVNTLGLEMRLIPAGTFFMGSPRNEKGRRPDERRHEVEITRAFYLAAHPVTVAQFRAFVDDTGHRARGKGDETFGWDGGEASTGRQYHWQAPGFTQRDDHPVVCVSWDDARAFCAWLAKAEGRPYRLPTEAEWEYACRGGAAKHTPYHFGRSLSPEQANTAAAPFPPRTGSLDGTVSVTAYPPNAFGLYQMHGNVWEWCNDWFSEDYYADSPRHDPPGPSTGTSRVCRGGGWSYRSEDCRSAYRGRPVPALRHFCVGFRIALSTEAAPPGGKRPRRPSRRTKGKSGCGRSRGHP